MFSVVLVDDEYSLRESIKKVVEWEKYNFRLIGTAENGLDALELMEKEGFPDVVITDIKMPIMDGIELATKLREEHPTIKIVFLSGYDDFKYAIEGIRLNVVSYLLKPISKDEMEESLSSLSKQLEEELLAVNDLSRVSEEYQENIQLMQAAFLSSLITDDNFDIPRNELATFLNIHQLNYLEKNKILFISRLSFRDKDTNYAQPELQIFSFYKLVREITGKYISSVVFKFSSNIVCLIAGSTEELNETIDIITKDIQDSVAKLLNEDVIIGVSDIFTEISQTRRNYLRATAALDYANDEEDENIVHISDIEKSSSNPQYIDKLDEASLLFALKTNDQRYVKELIDLLFKDIQHARDNRVSILRTLSSIIFVNCMRALRETIGTVDNEYNEEYHHIFELTQISDLNEIHSLLLQFCFKAMMDIQENRANQKNTLVVESIEYLEKNFTNPNISLKSISEQLDVSSTYFSSVFKKETGQSFIDTLTELKMNKAKELVLTTNKKIFEVASECGYDDQHYFSYSFKKYFDISPSQMRKSSIPSSDELLTRSK